MTTSTLKQVSPYILGLLITAEGIGNNKDVGRTLDSDEIDALRELGLISPQSIYLRQEGKDLLANYKGNRFVPVYMGEGICERIGKYYDLDGAGYELEPGRDLLLGAMVWADPDWGYLGVDTRTWEHDCTLAAFTLGCEEPPKYVSHDGYLYTYKETHRRSNSEIELPNGEYDIVEGHVLHAYSRDNEEWISGFGVVYPDNDLEDLYTEMDDATSLFKLESPCGPIPASEVEDAITFLATTHENLGSLFTEEVTSPESKVAITWECLYPASEDTVTWDHLYDVTQFWLNEFYKKNHDCTVMDDPKEYGVRCEDIYKATNLVTLACTSNGILLEN